MPKILFCGGGTLGPVTPLLAVLRKLRHAHPDLLFAWVGTEDGPEGALVEAEGVGFHALPRAALPRYPSKRWLTFPWDYLKASVAARKIIAEEKPSLIVSAGGFMQVPVMREAFKKGIPCAIHQLDFETLLSNDLVAEKCRLVTTSYAYPRPPFSGVEAHKVATPCRFAGRALPSRDEAATRFGLDPSRPILFVFGGGTGALAINQAIASVLDELLKAAQFIHLTGKGKGVGHALEHPDYQAHEFFDESKMLEAYAAADLVVSRGGFGALSEMAALKKAAIVVPIPKNPWAKNAEALGDAVRLVEQTGGLGQDILFNVNSLLDDAEGRRLMAEKLSRTLPTDDGSALAKLWSEFLPRD
jgi:UDP-N-acetylglucosamine--N-acetylmuramyl-(pentapeptide) pyrophosphoryl-undecaprenol N-acetylglucosamine transferase